MGKQVFKLFPVRSAATVLSGQAELLRWASLQALSSREAKACKPIEIKSIFASYLLAGGHVAVRIEVICQASFI